MNWLLIFLGGGLGSVVRYSISHFIAQKINTVFPLATLIANFLSCIALILIINYLSAKATLSEGYRFFLVVGFCGGFSTFSTFSYETFELFKQNHIYMGIGNIIISISACLAVIYLLAKN